MPSMGITGIVLIGVLALLLFGPKKLPELGRAVGTTIREFRSGSKALLTDADKSFEEANESRKSS